MAVWLPGQRITAARLNELDTTGTYAPTLTAETTNPNIGADGSKAGTWHRNGNLITVWIGITLAGTGVNMGGSSWRVSLPFLADLSLHVAGSLAAGGTVVGAFKTRSVGGGTYQGGVSMLYQLTGGASLGQALIFYEDGAFTSLGGGDWGTSGNFLVTAQYLADPADLP